jgi:hypothetical protein
MNTLYQSLLLTIGALALAGTALAQVPSTNDTSDDYANTGSGSLTLHNIQPGYGRNAAFGYEALYDNTTGNDNAAAGYQALANNTTGSANVALGSYALGVNKTGNDNAALGYYALSNNTSGINNTASGFQALFTNTTGNYNTASGYDALFLNTAGNYNDASGYFALHNNSGGSQNSAFGVQALYGNKTGNYNTASGTDALFANTTGSSNVAQGYKAGYNLTTGSNNIDIGNLGVAAESNTIRIGTTAAQTATYIAGIYGTSVTGSAVVVSSTGQLGVTVSSQRYKTAITPMGSKSARLDQLRPVTFHLKTDPKGALQYGLIAEEVAKVYPELVIRDGTGRIDSVRYDELSPMLLNEVQEQHRKMTTQEEKNAAQGAHIAAQDAEIRALKEQMTRLTILNQATQAALQKLQAQEALVVAR